jgi:hypothetical protein
MAPLNRALSFPQVNEAAVRVAQHLDLDVPRPVEVTLEVDAAVAERLRRLAARRLDAVARASGDSMTRIPFPSPPAAAFSSTG